MRKRGSGVTGMGRKDGIVFGTAAGIYGLRRLGTAGSSALKGLSSRPAKGPMGFPNKSGMTGGVLSGRQRQLQSFRGWYRKC